MIIFNIFLSHIILCKNDDNVCQINKNNNIIAQVKINLDYNYNTNYTDIVKKCKVNITKYSGVFTIFDFIEQTHQENNNIRIDNTGGNESGIIPAEYLISAIGS